MYVQPKIEKSETMYEDIIEVDSSLLSILGDPVQF